MTVATAVGISGRDQFRTDWMEAFCYHGVPARMFPCPVDLERHLSSGQIGIHDLLLAEAASLPTGSPADLRTARQGRACPFVVLITGQVTPVNWQWLGARNVMVLPPPSDPVAQRLMARWLLDLRTHQNHRDEGDSGLSVVVLAGSITVDFDARLLCTASAEHRLSRGEAEVLRYLVSTSGQWRSTADIGRRVFQRSDPAAQNLVWKYVSMLSAKLGASNSLLRRSRTFGYQVATEDVVTFGGASVLAAVTPVTGVSVAK